MEEHLLFFCSILVLGITAQWIAWKLRIPSILLLLATGFIAGIFYDQDRIVDEETLFAVVSLAVGVILLEGGLTLRFSELKEAGSAVLRLVGLGSLISWVISAVAAHYLGGFSWEVSILVAAILVVTGPTVIGPLLQSVKPQRSVNSILKWEGIVIDPVGAILAVLVFGVLFGHGHSHNGTHREETMGVVGLLIGIGKTLLIGIGLGYGAAEGLSHVLRRHWVPDFLQSVVVLTVGLALFTLSNLWQHESGLLTVTILGIALANQDRAKIRHVIEFKETLRTILISCLFIVLGARIGLDEIAEVWKEATLFLIALIVVVRPASVFLSMLGSTSISFREKLFLSMMAPRGIVAAAVSSVFAMELAKTGGAFAGEAAKIVPVTYFVIVGTVAFYGLLAGPVARKLKLAKKNPQGILFVGIRPWAIEAAKLIQDAGFRVLMIDSNYDVTATARMAGIPAVNANILSEFVSEDLDLVGIGNMIAATPNDQVNTLACINLGHSLGISHVFQLQPRDSEHSERKSSSTEFNGRQFSSRAVTSRELEKFVKSGAIIKQTLIKDTFSMEDFTKLYGDSAMVLFRLGSGNTLSVVTPDSLPASSGDQLISLVVEDEKDSVPMVEAEGGSGPEKLP
ncbi:MAG: sodium:proton antiporter [Verrucomicrobiales bacterium]|nr:sodium:proton antiporter [Verrucomicrobiales bacterium]